VPRLGLLVEPVRDAGVRDAREIRGRHEIRVTRQLLSNGGVGAGGQRHTSRVDGARAVCAHLELLQHHRGRRLHRDHDRAPENQPRGLVADRVGERILARKSLLGPVREIAEPRGLGLENISAFLGSRQSHPAVQRLGRDGVDKIRAGVGRHHLGRHRQLPVHAGVLRFEPRRLRSDDHRGFRAAALHGRLRASHSNGGQEG